MWPCKGPIGPLGERRGGPGQWEQLHAARPPLCPLLGEPGCAVSFTMTNTTSLAIET